MRCLDSRLRRACTPKCGVSARRRACTPKCGVSARRRAGMTTLLLCMFLRLLLVSQLSFSPWSSSVCSEPDLLPKIHALSIRNRWPKAGTTMLPPQMASMTSQHRPFRPILGWIDSKESMKRDTDLNKCDKPLNS